MINFENILLFDIKGIIDSEEMLYAHTNKNKKPETISEHSERTIYFFNKLVKEKNIDKILNNIIYNLKFKEKVISEDTADIIKEMYVNAIYLHDIGKINPLFQHKRMENKNIEVNSKYETKESKHSMLSAIIYIDIYLDKLDKLKSKKDKRYLRNVLYCFAYIISRHHTHLENLDEVGFREDLESKIEKLKEDDFQLTYYKYADRLKNINTNLFTKNNMYKEAHEPFEFYIITKLLYSTIVSCDFYATHLYDSGLEAEFMYIDDADKVFDVYKNTKIYKGIKEYKKNNKYFGENSINSLRSKMFIEAERNLRKNLDNSNIFYLEAPTGSGKTNTSINLALTIIKEISECNKIFYIFPFNTLVEQTKKTFDDIFNEKIQKDFRVAVINSITPIITEKEKGEDKNVEDEDTYDYKKDLLNRQMLHYPVALTTHINFFNYLFGTGREINLPLIHLCNSVVIIDEIQSYRNRIWPEIIKFLNMYSKLLNIKIIIMSATLPKLDRLLGDNEANFSELIQNPREYYEDELFSNRVLLNFELLEEEKDKKEIEEDIIKAIKLLFNKRGKSRVLIEFINKGTARHFYERLGKEFPNKRRIELTGDDSTFNRKKILDEINEEDKNGNIINDDLIVVATQVIEAGVNIDMDIGFKDISILDNEEQFLGRINRSSKKQNCISYFFNYDKASDVYKEDFRLEYDLRNKEYQDYLKSKNFTDFYKECFKRLHEKKTEYNENNIKEFEQNVMYLNFNKVNEHMKLIKDKNYQLFLAYEIIDENGKPIRGEDVWEQYKKLIKDKEMDYAKKKIELSNIAQKIDYFTYNFVDNGDKFDRRPKYNTEYIGNIFYVERAKEEGFITEDGKFDRKKYKDKQGGLFLG